MAASLAISLQFFSISCIVAQANSENLLICVISALGEVNAEIIFVVRLPRILLELDITLNSSYLPQIFQ